MKATPELVVLSFPPTGSNKLQTPLEDVKSYSSIKTKGNYEETQRTLRARIWAIKWQVTFNKDKSLCDAHPNNICHTELFLEHCPTGARPHDYEGQQNAQEQSNHVRFRELLSFRYSVLGRVFRGSISHGGPVLVLLPKYLDPRPSVQAQPPNHLHPRKAGICRFV